MFRLVLIAGLVACSLGARVPLPHLDGRIIGGELAPIDYAPYQVSIRADLGGTGQYSHFCGGTIITKDAIMTAAHCTKLPGNLPAKIRAGSALHSTGGVERGIRKAVNHEFYYGSLDYDFAIVFLDEDLELQTGLYPEIAAITLPNGGDQIVAGTKATVTGWGSVVENGPVQNELRFVVVPVVDQGVCEAFYATVAPVSPRMLCAGNIGAGGIDACNGDSGGPLVIDGVLKGVTSWGFGCGRPNYPGVYSRISSVRSWIDQTLLEK